MASPARNRLVFVHLLNDYSGSPKVLAGVIDKIKKNHRVLLFINRNSKGFLSNLKIATDFFPYTYRKNKVFAFFELLKSQVHLFVSLYKYRKDSIFYINTLLPFGAAIAGKLFGVKVIYHIHETSIRPLLLKKFLPFVAHSTSSAFIYVSRFLQNTEGFADIPSVCAHNVLDDAFLEQAGKEDYSPNPGQFNVVMLCSLKDYKGIPEFLLIADGLSHNEKIRFHLVLNADIHAINSYFSDKCIPDNTTVYPGTGDVHPFYKMASLVISLSRTDQWIETFGLTLLEAMAYGIPVIGPPVGGPTELIEEGVNGHLIDSRNRGEISKRILQMSKDRQYCMRLSVAGRKKSLHFTSADFEANILKALTYVPDSRSE